MDLGPLMASGVILAKLKLQDAQAKVISDNLYWLGAQSSDYRELNRLPPATVTASATSTESGDTVHIHVQIANRGSALALENKLTLLNATAKLRILPAYFSDNYISVLPGETRDVDIEYSAKAANEGKQELSIRGWNLAPQTIAITQAK
jgi:hypothetical protein